MSLLILPTVPKIQESQPVEEVYLIRDEMANMVWGIESIILLPGGESKPGREAALELRNFYQRLLGQESESDIEINAAIRYQIMNTVPENWIPFIPVHIDNNNREIQLQRANMLRIIEGDIGDPQKIRPRTILLRKGLDEDQPVGYKLFEEEISRAGVRIYQAYERTRWYNGKVFNWLGVRKQVGRGEGSSGLAFDQIVHVARSNTE
jgi:hypothetical protein